MATSTMDASSSSVTLESTIDLATQQSGWYLPPTATNDDATAALQASGPTAGAFVVRKSHSIANAFILAYVDDRGQIHNEVIKLVNRGLRLRRSKVPFADLGSLVAFYSNPQHHSVSTLPVVLNPSAILPGKGFKSPALNGATTRKPIPEGRTLLVFDVLVGESVPASRTYVYKQGSQINNSEKPRSTGRKRVMTRLSMEHWMDDNITDWIVDEQPLEEWTEHDVQEWLHSVGLAHVSGGFRERHITGEMLLRMEEADFVNMGIAEEDRDVLMEQLKSIPARRDSYRRSRLENRAPSENDVRNSWSQEAVSKVITAPTAPVPTWDKYSVRNWLLSEGFTDDVGQCFVEAEVDGPLLLELGPGDLEEIGVQEADDLQRLELAITRLQQDYHSGAARSADVLPAQVKDWDSNQVAMFMVQSGFGEYAEAFRRAHISGAVLLTIQPSDLAELGMSDPATQEAFLEEIRQRDRAAEAAAETTLLPAQVMQWSAADVITYCAAQGLSDAALAPLAAAGVDGQAFVHADDAALTRIGVTDAQHRQDLLKVIEDLRLAQQRASLNGASRHGNFNTSSRRPFVPGPRYVLLADRPVSHWDTADVAEWLQHENLGEFRQSFAMAQIDGPALLKMQDADLFRLGVTDTDKLNTMNAALRALRRRHRDEEARGLVAGQQPGQQQQQQQKQSPSRRAQQPPVEYQVVDVIINRGPTGFGFTLQGGDGADTTQQPTVAQVRRGGAADGVLNVGDQLLEVNGRGFLEEGALSEITDLIHRAGDRLELRVRRPLHTGDNEPVSPGPYGLRSPTTPSAETLPLINTSTSRTPIFSNTAANNNASLASAEDFSAFLRASDDALRNRSSERAHQDASRVRTSALLRGNRGSFEASSSFSRAHAAHASQAGKEADTSGAHLMAVPEDGDVASWTRLDDNNPLTWNNARVITFLESESLPESAKAAKKRKLTGAALVTMKPAEAASWEGVSAAEAARATTALTLLQGRYPAPLIARWSVNDVGDWLEHRNFGQRRGFLRRKIDGPALATLQQAQLDSLGVPASSRYPFMQVVTRLRQTFAPDTEQAAQWSQPEVRDWLVSAGFGSLTANFARKHITGSELLKLQYQDLYKMNIRDTGDQTRLLQAIAQLNASAAQAGGNSRSGSRVGLMSGSKQGRGGSGQNEALSPVPGDGKTMNSSVPNSAASQPPFLRRKSGTTGNAHETSVVSLRSPPRRRGQTYSEVYHHAPGHHSVPALLPTSLDASVQEWSAAQVCDWLAYTGLGRHCSAFVNKGITGAELLQLTPEKVKNDLGLSAEDAKELLFTIDLLTARATTLAAKPHPLYRGLWRWSSAEVELWLTSVGQAHHVSTFRQNDIDGLALASLNEEDLEDQLQIKQAADRSALMQAVDDVIRITAQPMLTRMVSWTTSEVGSWLTRQGLGQYAALFANEGIDGDIFVRLRAFNLQRIGLTSDAAQQTLLTALDAFKAVAAEPCRQLGAATSEWTAEDVAEWLEEEGYGQVALLFLSFGIGGTLLLTLSDEDLQVLGLGNMDQRTQLLAEIDALRQADKATIHGGSSTRSAASQILPALQRSSISAGPVSGSPGAAGLARGTSGAVNATVEKVVADWSLSDVGEWLVSQGLGNGRLPATFQAHSVTGPALWRLQPADLDRMQVSDLTERAAVLSAVARLRQQSSRDDGGAATAPTAGSGVTSVGPVAAWDKRSQPQFDPAPLLRNRPAGNFYVLEPRQGDLQLALAVDDEGTVRRYAIKVDFNPANGQPLYRLAASPENDGQSSLVALIERHKRQRGPLPTILKEPDMAEDIALRVHRRAAEPAWSWWQLDAASSSEAEAVLKDKMTGAFVIYRQTPQDARRGLVLAYKFKNDIHREDIYHTPGSAMFHAGFHLGKAQNKVGRDLHALVDIYKQPSAELLCPLRESIQPDPATHVYTHSSLYGRSASTDGGLLPPTPGRSPLSWLLLDGSEDGSGGELASRASGSFYVCKAKTEPFTYVLVYKHGPAVHAVRIVTSKLQDGRFVGFSLEGGAVRQFATLYDLVLFHERVPGSLNCTLNVAHMSLIARQVQSQQQPVGKLESWDWCQIGSSPANAKAQLTNGKPGRFVVRLAPAAGSPETAPADGPGLLLDYINAEGQLVSMALNRDADGKLSLAQPLANADVAVQANLEALICTCAKDATLLGVCLQLPARGLNAKVSSPSVVKRETSRELPWNWWQLGKSHAAALSVLEGKKNGAFVVRDNPAKPGSFLLSYKFQGRLLDESISHTPASSMFNQGYFLDRAQNLVYATLHELVEAQTQGPTGLQCALRISERPPADWEPSVRSAGRSSRLNSSTALEIGGKGTAPSSTAATPKTSAGSQKKVPPPVAPRHKSDVGAAPTPTISITGSPQQNSGAAAGQKVSPDRHLSEV